MRVISYQRDMHVQAVAEAIQTIQKGGVVIGPTDTVYGLLADATNAKAVQKIFKIKGRSALKALPIFVRDIVTARKLAYISDKKGVFLTRVWPGPVTIIFHHKEKFPKVLTGGKDTIGIRIPKHPFIDDLLARFETPLAQTSANISNELPARNLAELQRYFANAKEKPDLIIEAGDIAGKPSSVFDFTRDEPHIIRMGGMTQAEFDRIYEAMV